ncbi:MAG: hypothetical protein A4S09_13835 [Proteobacteria bacterium SG_bin7]|nr:MAG: hypothetical protein A4S09_13835 [Proteobacteria bacterium SG_bin7]
MYFESKTRIIIKTISWRLFGTLATVTLAYIFTRKIETAFQIGSLELLLKSLIYYFHERFWNKVNYGKKQNPPKVIWFTGLCGAGKTTIAQILAKKLRTKNIKIEELDGDSLRSIFPKTGFTRQDRDQHIRRVGHLASRLESHGVHVITSLVSPYRESREFARHICKNFFEVYISTPIETCEKRDPKGLYAKARAGEIKNFTGIDDPYEPPMNPEITVDTHKMSAEQAADLIIKGLDV